jgi:hypothetical protein
MRARYGTMQISFYLIAGTGIRGYLQRVPHRESLSMRVRMAADPRPLSSDQMQVAYRARDAGQAS